MQSKLDRLNKETAIIAYLDLSNMFHWQRVLHWSFRIEDLIASVFFIKSVKEVRVYYGLDERQLDKGLWLQKRIRKAGGVLISKPVKYIKKTVNESLIFKQSTMTLFDGTINERIVSLVNEIKQSGIIIEEPKCNFDVEMTMDLIDDSPRVSAVLLFSGDSDLKAPLERLKIEGKKVYIVGVRGMTAFELHAIEDMYIDFGKLYRGVKKYL